MTDIHNFKIKIFKQIQFITNIFKNKKIKAILKNKDYQMNMNKTEKIRKSNLIYKISQYVFNQQNNQ